MDTLRSCLIVGASLSLDVALCVNPAQLRHTFLPGFT